jgi:hypothetical protein
VQLRRGFRLEDEILSGQRQDRSGQAFRSPREQSSVPLGGVLLAERETPPTTQPAHVASNQGRRGGCHHPGSLTAPTYEGRPTSIASRTSAAAHHCALSREDETQWSLSPDGVQVTSIRRRARVPPIRAACSLANSEIGPVQRASMLSTHKAYQRSKCSTWSAFKSCTC